MPRSRFRVPMLLAAAMAATFAVPASADLVNNSFESPELSPSPGFLQFAGGSTAITGWTVVGQNIVLLHSSYSEAGSPFFAGMIEFNSQNGSNSADLTGVGNTNSSTNGIQQTVATTSGTLYELQFHVGRAQSRNGDSRYQMPSTVDLSINGGPRVGFTNSETVSPQGFVNWKQFTATFTATGPSTTITFLNATPFGTNFAGLDNVSLSPLVGLPADYNHDGSVDAADYVVWRKGVSPLPNDNTPGNDPGDFNRWKNHFGESLGGGGSSIPLHSSIPEPMTAPLLAITLLVAIAVTRHRYASERAYA